MSKDKNKEKVNPNIPFKVLYTVLYMFPKVLTRRICLIIMNFNNLVFISFILKSTIFGAVIIVMGEIGYLFLLENKKRLKEKITCQIHITKITPFFIHKQLN